MAFVNAEILLALVLILAVARILLSRTRDASTLPPGPPAHWLRGTKDIPKEFPWRWYTEVAKQYPEGVFTIYRGRTPLVIIGRMDAAIEILEKQAIHTADRPRQVVADEILGQGSRSLLVGYTDRWKRMRKALHAQTQPARARDYEARQEKISVNVLRDLLERPDTHQEAYRLYAANLVLSIAYAIPRRVTYSDDIIQRINKNTPYLCLRPGAWLANSYPWIQYLPFTLREPRKWSKLEGDLYKSNYEHALKSGAPSFATVLEETKAENQLSDRDRHYLAGTLFQAGTDTSAAAIAVSIMAAAVFPETQRKVQEELDHVVGRERLPLVSDWPDLIYTGAYIKEVLRWRPISAGGFEHKSTKDLVFRGIRIPKGTALLGPHWTLHMDASYFPEPDVFKPERWLNEDGSLKSDKELHSFSFGFGRRICVGLHIAQRSVFLNLARILWAFNVKEDEKRPIDTLSFSNTTNSSPLPFKVSFEPRFEGVQGIVYGAEAQE